MFKIMTSVLKPEETPTEEEIKEIPSYIFCKWLSGSPLTIFAANKINYYNNIPIECQYKLIKTVFSGKIRYIPYPKKRVVDDIKNIKDIEYISEYFNVSYDKAKEYLEFLEEKEMLKIRKIYLKKDKENKIEDNS